MKTETDYNFEAENSAISFKKVLRGFDPAEVTAYIEELNGNMRDASKNYEARMSEINQELTQSNRENSTLRAKCASLEVQLASAMAVNSCSIESEEIPGGNSKILKGQSEETESKQTLKNELEQASARIDELLKELRTKESELAEEHAKIEELEYQSGTQSEMRDNYKTALADIETMKSEAKSLAEEKAGLEEELRENKSRLLEAEAENSNLKTELSRIGVENMLLTKKNEQHKAEINGLTNEAKTKAYDYAAKLAEEKAALDREKTAYQKKLQLQTFNVEQAVLAVDELKKQVEQLRISLSE